ncbi:MAG: hypothetical protein EAZ55_05010 [Cytophagales bacterium]|nr:MAG: hypothetical protein EAZ55_05010 [Cytophagales bacterium]
MLLRKNLWIGCIFGFLWLIPIKNKAQSIVYEQNFNFLRLPTHPQVAALGGVNISSPNNSVHQAFQQPALLNKNNHAEAGISYTPFFAQTQAFQLQYGFAARKTQTWAIGIQYFDYGTMPETDATGQIIGSFKASEYALQGSRTFQYQNFHFGLNVKLVGSQIANYQALGLALDAGALFIHPEKDFSIGLVIKNAGFLFNDYSPQASSRLPFDAHFGLSHKPQFMPIRFSVTLQNLFTQSSPSLGILENWGQKIIIGAEILFHKAFQINIGYNQLRNEQLKTENGRRWAGFSIGCRIKARIGEFSYARAAYMGGVGQNWIGCWLYTQQIFQKK